MKTFLLTVLLTAVTGGLASAGGGYNGSGNSGRGYRYSACANNNSKACRDARDAFARHHNGQTPDQYNNTWYQGQQGRWDQNNNNWQWNGVNGDQYRNGHNGWQWSGRQKQDRDHDRE